MTSDQSGGVGEHFAVAPPGLEQVVAAELTALGFEARAEQGGAAWNGALTDTYRANLNLRSAARMLLRMNSFRARTFYELERHAARIDWRRFLSAGGSAAFRVTSRKSKLYHEGAIAERLMNAVAGAVDGVRFTDVVADEDDVEGDAQLFIVRVVRDGFTISADSSGALLHRRGYRQAAGKAPLRENLAAAMLLAAEWNGTEPLVDPLCGSGTIPIEAALVARRIAPGIANPNYSPREYAFQKWPDFDAGAWVEEVHTARERILPRAAVQIVAADRNAGAITASRENARRAGVEDDIDFAVRPLSALEVPGPHGLLLTNPPYGVRVGESGPLRDLYAALGNVARDRLGGWSIGWLSADPRFDAQTKLPAREVFRTKNGGIEVRLMLAEVRPDARGQPHTRT